MPFLEFDGTARELPRGETVDVRITTGYGAGELDEWARIARSWRGGHAPDGLSYQCAREPPAPGRDVFVYMINGAKIRAPAAAKALAERL